MSLLAIQRGLWVALLVAQTVLIGALFYRGLAKKYPLFTIYLSSDAIWGLTLIQIDFRTPAYAVGYRAYVLTVLILQLAVAGELYEKICGHFQNIGRFRTYLCAALAGFGAILSLATFWPRFQVQWSFPQTLYVFADRFETTVICVILILTRFVLYHFMNIRPGIRPNVLNHWMLLTAYFGITALATAAMLLTGGGKASTYPINIAMLSGELACITLWIRALTSEGERRPLVYRLSPEVEARRAEMRGQLLKLVEDTRDKLLDRR